MARSSIDDAIKLGGLTISILTVILSIMFVNISLQDPARIIEPLIYLMVIISIISSFATFFKKSFR